MTNAKTNGEWVSYPKGTVLEEDIIVPDQFSNGDIQVPVSFYYPVLSFFVPLTKSIPKNTTLSYDLYAVIDAPQGNGIFEYKTHNSLSAKLEAKAYSNEVLISPIFYQSEPRNAIMLFPMYTLTSNPEDTTSIFNQLVNKGYATTLYMDSAASRDKFSNLDKYNAVLSQSHMSNKSIYL